MGCGSSYLPERSELDMLEVLFRFPCESVSTLRPTPNHPQLVVGRITGVTKRLLSPYSCQECALYRVECFIREKELDNNPHQECRNWQRVHTEVRGVTFFLQDPEQPAKSVRVPAKLLSVQYYCTDVFEDFCEQKSIRLHESTPSLTAFLERCGLKDVDLNDIRLREWCVEENTQVGVFGVISLCEENYCELDDMIMKPLHSKAHDITDCIVNKKDAKRYYDMAFGDRSIVVIEDRNFYQGVKVRPFAAEFPPEHLFEEQGNREKDSLMLKDITPDVIKPLPNNPKVIRRPTTGETHVRIPPGAMPGSQIAVPGPRGSHLITITVPLDFRPGDTHIFDDD